MFELSFSEAFFSGDGTYDLYDMPSSDEPTSVWQALVSMQANDNEQWVEMVGDVLGVTLYPNTGVIGLVSDLLDHVRETNTCFDIRTPVEVYIDPEYQYSVFVY